MSSNGTTIGAGRRDLIAGSILLVFAIAWTATVYFTVPFGSGYGVGPRAFPLFLGISLVVLSAAMVIASLRGRPLSVEEDSDGGGVPAAPVNIGRELFLTIGVVAIIALYGFLMQRAGFVLATMMVVAGTLIFVLGIRRPLLVIGMSLGISFGGWLVFGKLLGSYMPRGTWIPFF